MSIVVIGSANLDLVTRTARHPRPGETAIGSDLLMIPGGKGANQAVAARRLGAEVAFVGRLGRDAFGDQLLAALDREGLNLQALSRDDRAINGVAMIVVNEQGENSIVVAPGTNHRLSTDDIERTRPMIAAANLVLLQFEIPWAPIAYTIDLCHELGVPTIVNPAPLCYDLPDETLSRITYLVPNEHEAAALLQVAGARQAPIETLNDAEAALHELAKRGVDTPIITLGHRGAMALHAGELLHVRQPAVEAIDTTGAGDCFIGALAAALDTGEALEQALQQATRAAAIAVTRRGAQQAMPTLADLHRVD